jgi:quinolinate synthase
MKMDLETKIEALKDRFGFRVVSHYFTLDDVHRVSDFVGDSLEIAYDIMENKDQPTIACTTLFMVETAKLLSPETEIFTPVKDCQCDMVSHLTEDHIRLARGAHPTAPLVLYFNSPTYLKPFADALCTASTAVNVVESFESSVVLFGPDMHIASYLATHSRKQIVSICEGYCYVHQYGQEDIDEMLREYPEACVVMHPECSGQIQQYAEYIGGTTGMRKHVANTDHESYVVGCDPNLALFIARENPAKLVMPLDEENVCCEMRRFNQRNIYDSMKGRKHRIEIGLDNEQAEYVRGMLIALKQR